MRAGCVAMVVAALAMMAAGGAARGAEAQDAGALLQKGIYEEETVGNIDAAMGIYREVIEKDRESRRSAAEAGYRLGVCYLKKNQPKEAVAAFEDVTTRFADEKEIVQKAREGVAKARAGLGGDEVEAAVAKAVETISTLSEGDPRVKTALDSLKGLDQDAVVAALAKHLGSNTANERRAAIYILWMGDFKSIDAAVPGLMKLLSHEEEYTRGMAALALGAKKVAASYDALARMTLQDKSGYARRCAAIALGWLGDARAKDVLTKALKDEDGLVRGNAESALKLLGEAQGAASAEQPGATRPAPEPMMRAAWPLWELVRDGKYAEAEAQLKQKVAAEPDAFRAWSWLGWSQYFQGRYDDAAQSFLKATSINPGDWPAMDGLGWVARKQGKNDEAAKYWKKLGLIGNYKEEYWIPTARQGLGDIATEQGRYRRALVYYGEWLKERPDDAEAKRAIEEAEARDAAAVTARGAAQRLGDEGAELLDTGHLAEARRKLELATKTDAENRRNWDLLGWAAYHLQDMAAARAAFETALSVYDTEDLDAVNGLAYIAYDADDRKQAEELWLKATREIGTERYTPSLYPMGTPWAHAAGYLAATGLAGIYIGRGEFARAENLMNLAMGWPGYSGTAVQQQLKSTRDWAAANRIAAEEAAAAAVEWLDLVDNGKYGDAWDGAARILKDRAKKDDWSKEIAGALAPLGKAGQRRLSGAREEDLCARHQKALPKEGEEGYRVEIRYQTQFENKKDAVETILMVKETGGKWRAADYIVTQE